MSESNGDLRQMHRYLSAVEQTPTEVIAARLELARREEGLSGQELRERLGAYLGDEWDWPSALMALSLVLHRPVAWFFRPSSPEQAIRFPRQVRKGVAVMEAAMGGEVESVERVGDRIVRMTIRF